MVVKVASRIGQALSHSLDGFSLAPNSMLLRLRRVSLGVLCLVAAVGLGLIAFIAQLDWPAVLSGPLPGAPTKVGRLDDAVGLTSPSQHPIGVSSRRAAVPLPASVARGRHRGSAEARSGLGRSRNLAGAPLQPSPGAAQPVAPAPASPGDVPRPVESAPAATVPVSTTEGGGSSRGSAKATADGGKAAGLNGSNSQGQKSSSQGQKSSAKSSQPATSNAGGSAAAKAQQDESGAGKPPAPAPEAKPSPGTSPASAKEAADAANSQ
jgi:hypothetical protein